MSEPQTRLNQQDARQGKGGVRLTMILGAVLLLAVIVGIVLYSGVY
ncbi:MAG: hypothetical protein JWN07_1538 [Hyphomicrobiales bacterium]|nr:hypothetical protein [Hyphomicrobiales bacterium]